MPVSVKRAGGSPAAARPSMTLGIPLASVSTTRASSEVRAKPYRRTRITVHLRYEDGVSLAVALPQMRLANKPSIPSSPRQKLHGHVIHGIVECAHNDEESARADLRALKNAPVLRKRLLDSCHGNDQLRDDQ